MKSWLALVPFAAFVTAFCVGAIGLWFVAKRTKISRTETQYGQALHVESPIGTLDVDPEEKLDERLTKIPIYRGAMPDHPMTADSVSELHVGTKTFKEISTTYWTSDNIQQVWDFTASNCRTGRGIWLKRVAKNSFIMKQIACAWCESRGVENER